MSKQVLLVSLVSWRNRGSRRWKNYPRTHSEGVGWRIFQAQVHTIAPRCFLSLPILNLDKRPDPARIIVITMGGKPSMMWNGKPPPLIITFHTGSSRTSTNSPIWKVLLFAKTLQLSQNWQVPPQGAEGWPPKICLHPHPRTCIIYGKTHDYESRDSGLSRIVLVDPRYNHTCPIRERQREFGDRHRGGSDVKTEAEICVKWLQGTLRLQVASRGWDEAPASGGSARWLLTFCLQSCESCWLKPPSLC